MVSVWVAVLGIVGTLVAAVLTQILTNRREFQRDQLKWAQERQQRELDVQKVAFVEARIALNDWNLALQSVVLWVSFPLEPKPELVDFSAHLAQANGGLATVELVCSEAAITAMHDAVGALTQLHLRALEAARETEMNRSVVADWCTSTPPDVSQVRDTLARLLAVCRADLAKLSNAPVVTPEFSRKRFWWPWRRHGSRRLQN